MHLFKLEESDILPPPMSHSTIDAKEVRHVARLARLALSDEEAETMRGHLNSILDYMAELEKLNVQGVDPTFHAVPMETRLRDDTETPSLMRNEVLATAPSHDAGAFAVPRILETE
jgi:aspartyl-tRNA(Asn)/glutamyl-tRNA(Gln) amidotransferase subunit C